MGPKLSDQYREDTDRPPTRRPHVGRPGEYVFLDRSVDWGWRRILEPGAAVCGQKIVAALLRLRVCDLRHSLTASLELRRRHLATTRVGRVSDPRCIHHAERVRYERAMPRHDCALTRQGVSHIRAGPG